MQTNSIASAARQLTDADILQSIRAGVEAKIDGLPTRFAASSSCEDSRDCRSKKPQRASDDHRSQGENNQAVELVTRLKVRPEESDTSQSLRKTGADTLARLKAFNGAQFDKAYVDNEVAYHQSVIDALDKTLIPNAQNTKLKTPLVKVRPAFLAHLNHARQMRSSMK